MPEPLSAHVSYDELPYDGGCISVTHPARMGAIGHLFGMNPSLPAKARVLELGCGGGSNLLPMAFGMPAATFVGIDNSSRQIEIAKSRAQALGLHNTTLLPIGIEEAGALEGPFDYIICHGVYSWVPDHVRTATLELVQKKLSPHGLALISYNSLPGWNLRKSVRDMMVYHGRYFPDAAERATQARALVDFVAEATGALSTDTPGVSLHHHAVSAVRELIEGFPDYYVVHEFMESDNEAFYLHQFAERVEAHGLQYLGDSDFATMVSYNLPPEIAQTLERISVTNIAMEQYRDFLVNRSFRHSLVCHADVRLQRSLEPSVTFDLWFSLADRSRARKDDLTTMRGADGRVVSITAEPALNVLRLLSGQYPRGAHFNQLFEGAAGEATPEAFGQLLLTLLAQQVIEVTIAPFDLVEAPPGKPLAWLPASVFGRDTSAVPTRTHQSLSVNKAGRLILRLLDGSRDEEQLVRDAYPLLATDDFVFEADDGTLLPGEDLPRQLAEELTRNLVASLRLHAVVEN